MTLDIPRMIVPGACACAVDGQCLCAPADFGETLTRFVEARYRGDSAEMDRLRPIVYAALTPQPQRKDSHDMSTAIPGTRHGGTILYPTDKERQDAIDAAAIRVGDVWGPERAYQLRADCAATSDTGIQTRCRLAIEAADREVARRESERAGYEARIDSAITDEDIRHAADELQDRVASSGWTSPHATPAEVAPEDVLSRARQFARARLAREDADALALATPRAQLEDVPDPFDPLANGAGQFASPHARKER